MDAAGGGYAVELAEADGLVIADAAEQTTGIVPPTGDGGALAELRGWSGPVERDIRVYSVMAPDRTNDTVGLDAHCCQAEKGVLTLRVAEVLPPSEAARAHRLLKAGGLRGRVVLDFSGDAGGDGAGVTEGGRPCRHQRIPS